MLVPPVIRWTRVLHVVWHYDGGVSDVAGATRRVRGRSLRVGCIPEEVDTWSIAASSLEALDFTGRRPCRLDGLDSCHRLLTVWAARCSTSRGSAGA